jgi:hypothetical protein
MTVARLGSISLDCADPAELAEFWAQVLGGEIAFANETFVAVKTDRMWLTAVKVNDFNAPTWPEGRVPKQIHLDLAVDDLDAAEAEAVRLGATLATVQPEPDRWRVLIDPAGHPFCVSSQIPE